MSEGVKFYRTDDNKYVGYLVNMPGVVSQADSLEELSINLKDAYKAMVLVLNESVEEGFTFIKSNNLNEFINKY